MVGWSQLLRKFVLNNQTKNRSLCTLLYAINVLTDFSTELALLYFSPKLFRTLKPMNSEVWAAQNTTRTQRGSILNIGPSCVYKYMVKTVLRAIIHWQNVYVSRTAANAVWKVCEGVAGFISRSFQRVAIADADGKGRQSKAVCQVQRSQPSKSGDAVGNRSQGLALTQGKLSHHSEIADVVGKICQVATRSQVESSQSGEIFDAVGKGCQVAARVQA